MLFLLSLFQQFFLQVFFFFCSVSTIYTAYIFKLKKIALVCLSNKSNQFKTLTEKSGKFNQI